MGPLVPGLHLACYADAEFRSFLVSPWVALRRPFRFLACVLSLAFFAGCGTRVARLNGEGFGGGDPFNRRLASLRVTYVQAGLDLLLAGESTGEFCALTECTAPGGPHPNCPEEQPSQTQIDFCRDTFFALLPQLRERVGSRDVPLYGLMAELRRNGIPVAALTALLPSGPIELSIPRILALGLSDAAIIALLVHEFLHKVLYRGAPIRDDQPLGPFQGSRGGEAFLDLAGLAFVRYLGHVGLLENGAAPPDSSGGGSGSGQGSGGTVGGPEGGKGPIGSSPATTPPGDGRLVLVSDSPVPFGVVEPSDSLTKVVRLSNAGQAAAVLVQTAENAHAPFFVIGGTCAGRAIAGGEECTLLLQYAPSDRGIDDGIVILSYVTNTSTEEVEIPVTARTRLPVVLAGTSLNRATVLARETVAALGNIPDSFRFPYGLYAGTARVAAGRSAATGDDVLVTGAGPGGGPHLKAFSLSTGALLYSAFSFDPAFTGGIYVAAGDVNGDRHVDYVSGAGPSGEPRVKIVSGFDHSVIWTKNAYDPRFNGGVRVAVADLTGDDRADVVTAAGTLGGPHVRVFDGPTGALLWEIFAFEPEYTGGIFAAAGDFDGDGDRDIAVITEEDTPRLRIFEYATRSLLRAYTGPGLRGSGHLAAGDYDGDGADDLLIGSDPGLPAVRVLSGRTLGLLSTSPLATSAHAEACPALWLR